LLPQRRQLRT